MDQYRELTSEEVQQFVDEFHARERWEKAKRFAERLYGSDAKKMWLDVGQNGYVHQAVVYGQNGDPLPHNFDAPFWKESYIKPNKFTWGDFLEQCYEVDRNDEITRRQGGADKQRTARRILMGEYHHELHDCLCPDKDYSKEDKLNPENRIIDYDFDSPPPLSFPNVFIPVK